MTVKTTPLYKHHLELNAKMTSFSDWTLPIQYSGIIQEHLHTRHKNTIFDISHMGEFLLEGPGAQTDVEKIMTCNTQNISDYKCKYGFLLNDNGNFIDDAIVFKFSSEKYMIVVNAGQTETDKNWIKSKISSKTTFTDISDATAKIDLQGPWSFKTAEECFPDANLKSMKRFSFAEFKYKNKKIIASTTGYTGEYGFELFMRPDIAPEIWQLLLSVDSVIPAGLGARDSLRLEKGYPLYGHDITAETNPVEANLERFVDYSKSFIGKKAITGSNYSKFNRRLMPFLCEGRRTARANFSVYFKNEAVGFVTSGVYSPVINKSIGLCLIDDSASYTGAIINCRKDKTEINAVIVDLPFVR